jgi:hypothetical protein
LADARSRKDLVALHDDRLRAELLDAFRHANGIGRLPEVVQEDHEFVAAVPGQRVFLTRVHVLRPGPGHEILSTYGAGQALSIRHEQRVASRVSEAVVDMLEAIEVDEQHGELIVTMTHPAGQLAIQSLGEQHAVGELRQVIVNGIVHQAVACRSETRAHVVERVGHGRDFCASPYRQTQREVSGGHVRCG